MFLEDLRKEENLTYTENGALTNRSTNSYCLDLFATIGALRNAEDNEIISRFIKAYTEDNNMAMKILFFARDIRGGLGERRVFRSIWKWLSLHEAESVRKNITNVPEYGRFDDLLSLLGGPCEKDMLSFIKEQLDKDLAALKIGESVSLLAKWLPSVNTSNKDSVKTAKKLAKALGFSDTEYRKVLVSLRAEIKLMENYLREKDYSFSYEKQPSKALYKYRLAFLRNDRERYSAFLEKAEKNPSVMNTGTLTPYDVVAPIINKDKERVAISKWDRRSMDITWKALPDYTGAENALAVVDGSASMYWYGEYIPAAVAQSLGIYFAEHNKGCFHNHFITFSENPRLIEVKGKDIVEKLRYCMSFNECANTDLQRTFDLILNTAIQNKAKQEEIPEKLYIISDMEFDYCANHAEMTNFECAKKKFAKYGYKLPQIVFWNVESRNLQQPVTKNEQGVALVSGASPQIFSMLSEGILDPYSFMLETLSSERYERISA
ncbi:DUF2828 family protein [Oribacterium sinus]|uniref:DUF2828 domain-containing protein n=1 Tax=Oribacterium sinus F0268 TaxID=585501 RepID=C2L093_9FIRM|nr:DUF2828 family protein [Oribacterium sinus]EEJ50561.1 hypothetical protein HMPREF6123_2162 [Oribacterium sinus F0268]